MPISWRNRTSKLPSLRIDTQIPYASGYDTIGKIQNHFRDVLATNALPESNREETLENPNKGIVFKIFGLSTSKWQFYERQRKVGELF